MHIAFKPGAISRIAALPLLGVAGVWLVYRRGQTTRIGHDKGICPRGQSDRRQPDTSVRFLLAMLSAAMVAGCSRDSTIMARIQSAGGEAALRRECQSIFDWHQKNARESFESAAPPAIAALKPQIIQVSNYDGLPMVDIQLSGGFSHRGLIVILTNPPAGFRPRKSSWKITKIGDGIFEYRE